MLQHVKHYMEVLSVFLSAYRQPDAIYLSQYSSEPDSYKSMEDESSGKVHIQNSLLLIAYSCLVLQTWNAYCQSSDIPI